MWPDQGLIQTSHNPRFLVSYCSPDNPHNSVSDTLESFLSKVAFESDSQKKLARTEHVLIISLFRKKKNCESFHDTGAKFLSKVTFETTFWCVTRSLP